MRRAINENPVVQVVIVGILLIVVGFLLMTRVFTSGEEAGPSDATTSATDPATSGAEASPEAEEAVADAAAADAAATDAAAAGADAAAEAAAGAGAPASEFVAGPGLPEPVVAAHDAGDTVVLLITRKTGTDDKRMKDIVSGFRGQAGVAVFMATAKNAATYARITEGVNLDRVPALVVISPPSASKGPLPKASVSYAYRSAESVEQAIRDAGYKGPRLPYHPE